MEMDVNDPLARIGLTRQDLQPLLDKHMQGLTLDDQQGALLDVGALIGLAAATGAPIRDGKFAMSLRVLADVLDHVRPHIAAIDQMRKLDPTKAGN